MPDGTLSLALIVHDYDVPSRPDDVNQEGRTVPADLPRVDFFHWTLFDLPPDLRSIAAGSFADGVTAHGKPGPMIVHGPVDGALHGLNGYTEWFAGDPDMAGDYYGYDGPCPPWNDSLRHHYVFTLYALSVDRLDRHRPRDRRRGPRGAGRPRRRDRLDHRALFAQSVVAVRDRPRRRPSRRDRLESRAATAGPHRHRAQRGRHRAGGAARGRARHEPIAAIHSSDLARALATAEPVAAALGMPVVRDARLRERNYGVLEGKTFDEIVVSHPEDAERMRSRDALHAARGGESPTAFHQRVVAAVSDIARAAEAAHGPDSVVLIVTHGGVLDMLYRTAQGLALDAERACPIPNAVINRLTFDDGRFVVRSWAEET